MGMRNFNWKFNVCPSKMVYQFSNSWNCIKISSWVYGNFEERSGKKNSNLTPWPKLLEVQMFFIECNQAFGDTHRQDWPLCVFGPRDREGAPKLWWRWSSWRIMQCRTGKGVPIGWINVGKTMSATNLILGLVRYHLSKWWWWVGWCKWHCFTLLQRKVVIFHMSQQRLESLLGAICWIHRR